MAHGQDNFVDYDYAYENQMNRDNLSGETGGSYFHHDQFDDSHYHDNHLPGYHDAHPPGRGSYNPQSSHWNYGPPNDRFGPNDHYDKMPNRGFKRDYGRGGFGRDRGQEGNWSNHGAFRGRGFPQDRGRAGGQQRVRFWGPPPYRGSGRGRGENIRGQGSGRGMEGRGRNIGKGPGRGRGRGGQGWDRGGGSGQPRGGETLPSESHEMEHNADKVQVDMREWEDNPFPEFSLGYGASGDSHLPENETVQDFSGSNGDPPPKMANSSEAIGDEQNIDVPETCTEDQFPQGNVDSDRKEDADNFHQINIEDTTGNETAENETAGNIMKNQKKNDEEMEEDMTLEAKHEDTINDQDEWLEMRGTDEYHCKLCDISANCLNNWRCHVKGKSHAQCWEVRNEGKPFGGYSKKRNNEFLHLSELGSFSYVDDALKDEIDVILGLSYLKEYHSRFGIQIICELCAVKFHINTVGSHLLGAKHRIKYLKENYYLTKNPPPFRLREEKSGLLTPEVIEYCKELEKREGRGKSIIKLYDPKCDGTKEDVDSYLMYDENIYGEKKEEMKEYIHSKFSNAYYNWVHQEGLIAKANVEERIQNRPPIPEPFPKYENKPAEKYLTVDGYKGGKQYRDDYPPCHPREGHPMEGHRDRFEGRDHFHEPFARRRYLPPGGPLPPIPYPERGLLPLPSRHLQYDYDPYLDPRRRAMMDGPYLKLDPLSRPTRDPIYLDPLKRSLRLEPYLDPDPLKRIRKSEPYLDPDPLKRVLPSQQQAKKAIVFDYGHGTEEKSVQKTADEWEKDIKDILGDSKKGKEPDSLALLSSSYCSPKRHGSPPSSSKELPFSKSYMEKYKLKKPKFDTREKSPGSKHGSKKDSRERRRHHDSSPRGRRYSPSLDRSKSRFRIRERGSYSRTSWGLKISQRGSRRSRSRSQNRSSNRSLLRSKSSSRSKSISRSRSRSKSKTRSRSRSKEKSRIRSKNANRPKGPAVTIDLTDELSPGRIVEEVIQPKPENFPPKTATETKVIDEDDAQAERIAEMLLSMKSSVLMDDADPRAALKALLSKDITEVLLAARQKENLASTPKKVEENYMDHSSKNRVDRVQSQAARSSMPHGESRSKSISREKIAFAFQGKSSMPARSVLCAFGEEEEEEDE